MNPLFASLLIKQTEDPAGQTGWRFAANSRKSSATLDGLTTGKRYWFRVTAEGAAGLGPASDAATKVAAVIFSPEQTNTNQPTTHP